MENENNISNIGIDQIMSLISRNNKIYGEIEGNENLIVEGYVKGSIKINGDIIIENSGIVKAEIEAVNAIIKGEVIGNVVAMEHLEIQASGKMTGDIYAKSIDIKEGSSFDGRSHMMKKKRKSKT